MQLALKMNSLQEIGLKHGTDKATYHQYLDFYEKYMDKNSIKKFLEIGIFGGASIKTWREWLNEDAIIEGWDINPFPIIENCDLRIVNQLKRDEMKKNITGIYDVILDDGGHMKDMMETSFAFLFPYCKMYVIEDLHAPWTTNVYPAYLKPSEIPTLDLIQSFKKNGWHSKYGSAKECDYINKNAELLDVFIRGDRKKPLSATAIFINKANK